MGIDVIRQLDGFLEIGLGDFAVGQPEAFNLASFTRKLPEDLHRTAVHHLGEVRRRGWHCMDRNQTVRESGVCGHSNCQFR